MTTSYQHSLQHGDMKDRTHAFMCYLFCKDDNGVESKDRTITCLCWCHNLCIKVKGVLV